MFHLVSKLLHVFSMPLIWVVVLFFLGLIIKNRTKGKRLLWLSFVLLYLFSNEFIFNEVNRIWEPEMTSMNVLEKHEVGIVLGGYSVFATKANQVNFSESADRFIAGIELYKQKKIKKLMYCGGHGSLFNYHAPEGQYSVELAARLGIPERDLIVESNSKNTWQNAVNSKKVLDSLGINGSVILITSSVHMPRSLGCYNKVGFKDVTPYVVDGSTGPHKWLIDYLLIPNPYTLMSWNKIIHEWIGLATYKLIGYN